jgi:hypothetical protein
MDDIETFQDNSEKIKYKACQMMKMVWDVKLHLCSYLIERT